MSSLPTHDLSAFSHYLILTYCAWGHTKPLLSLALTLLLHHSHLHLTVLVYAPLSVKVDAEIRGWELREEQTGRLKLVPFGAEEGREEKGRMMKQGEVGEIGDMTVNAYAEAYLKLLQLSPPALNPFATPPTLIIIDASIAAAFLLLKLAVEKSVWGVDMPRANMLTFHPASSAYVALMFFKDSVVPGLVETGIRELEAAGKTAREVYDTVFLNNTTLAPIVGQQPMYLFEHEPSQCHPLDRWLFILHSLQTLYASHVIDGTIVSWPADLSPRVQEASVLTFDEGNFFQVGPLLAPKTWARKTEARDGGDEVMEFLGLAEERSVVFVSFGSIFFPPTYRHMEILLEVLIELRIRFVLTKGRAEDEVVEMMERMVAKSEGRGLLADWVDQEAVLSHKSLSFFLTHAGSNSAMESLVHGVPMIAWPGTFDQPAIAAELSLAYRVAFELLQVKQGTCLHHPLSRGTVMLGTDDAVRDEMKDVLLRSQGEEGRTMRERAREVGALLSRSRERGGKSWEAVERLGWFA